ncbi:MAG: undecaprenyl-diphosphate phosphatase [Chloroflexi bacterium]|nr:undecaprenyl-diphosphate phosphatase [Chloroflexota bacterium]
MLESIVLGIVQGATEWLPVSSEGSVTAVASLLFDLTLSDALAFALWLHIGTAIAATIAFRRELIEVAREALRDPMHPSPLLRFLVLGTLFSAILGFPMLMVLEDLSSVIGGGTMLAIGVAMLVTAVALRAPPDGGSRHRNELTTTDAVVFGIAQGLATVPGLSRSGLTVAALLGRGLTKSEALAVSFVMSIPASIGAALIGGFDSNGPTLTEGIVGATVAMVVGIATIRALLSVAERVNFAVFVAGLGLLVICGGVLQLVI